MDNGLERRQTPFQSGAFRFALVFATIFAISAFLLLGMVRDQIGRYAHEATIGALTTESSTLAAEDPSHIADEIMHRVKAAPDGNFVYGLFDADGRPVMGKIPERAAHQGFDRVVMQEHAPTAQDPEYPERLMTLGTKLTNGLLLVVASDGYDIDKLRRHMVRFMITWAVMITLAALVAGWMAGRFYLVRLSAVNAAIERIMAGRTEQRLPMIGLGPELDELTRNLNRMLDRIDGLVAGFRQVSTDVAHDLRTPLTRLRQMLEGAREARSRDETNAGIEMAMAQADHLLSVFRAMLRLAQIEGGGRRTPFAPVDLTALISNLMETYEPVALDAKHQLILSAADEACVLGDPELLAQLFANLIENAILHTPVKTIVTIGIETTPKGTMISISDNGPGVPPAEHERITGRFYQLDPSRSSGSAGLGLAIARAIAQLHGADLEMSDAEPGLRVMIRFQAG